MNPDRANYILITGCTGVGKSSVAEHLHATISPSVLYSDPFVENPFILDTYLKGINCFQSEMFFFKEFLKIHKAIKGYTATVFQERSIFECVEIFCRLFLYQNKIDQREFDLLQDLLQELIPYMRMPDRIIHLTADTRIILKRIANRKREFETSIDCDFIEMQSRLYTQWIEQFVAANGIPLSIIDNSDQNIFQTIDLAKSTLKPLPGALTNGI